MTLPGVANPQNGGATTNPTYQYGYDVFGNQTSIQDPLGRVTQFTFDERGNELSRTLPLGVETPSNPNDFTETFQYDDLGRQTLHVSFEGAVTQSIYDPETGRLSEKRFFDNLTDYNGGVGTPNETWTYAYDAFDRVVSVTQTAGTTTSTTTTTKTVAWRRSRRRRACCTTSTTWPRASKIGLIRPIQTILRPCSTTRSTRVAFAKILAASIA